MHILIIIHAYPPEIRSSSVRTAELAEDLAADGHQVTVLTPVPKYHVKQEGPSTARLFSRESKGNLTVIRIATLPIHMVGLLRRAAGFISYLMSFFIAGCLARRADVIFAHSTPFLQGLMCYLLSLVHRAPFVFNVQDLFPVNAVELGFIENPTLVRVFEMIESWTYKKATYLTVPSEGHRDHIIRAGGKPSVIRLVPNWFDIDTFGRTDSADVLKRELGLDSEFIVLFAGVMGKAQDLDVILEAAHHLRGNQAMRFLFAGEGMDKARVVDRAKLMGLDNVGFPAVVEPSRYPQLVSLAHICLVTLKASMQAPVIPSKIFGYMAGGKPIVASFNLESEAAKFLQRSGAAYVAPAGDGAALAACIAALYRDPLTAAAMGERGRRLVCREFSRKVGVDCYRTLFQEAQGSCGGAGPSLAASEGRLS